VTKLGRLFLRAVNRNRHLTRKSPGSARRKRQHVRRVILAQELTVQAVKFAVIRKQALKVTPTRYFGTQRSGEGAELRSR
jgi:hypothetical protein